MYYGDHIYKRDEFGVHSIRKLEDLYIKGGPVALANYRTSHFSKGVKNVQLQMQDAQDTRTTLFKCYINF
nr:MAG TPA: hypothetical protein [Caudoviricetes sp.]